MFNLIKKSVPALLGLTLTLESAFKKLVAYSPKSRKYIRVEAACITAMRGDAPVGDCGLWNTAESRHMSLVFLSTLRESRGTGGFRVSAHHTVCLVGRVRTVLLRSLFNQDELLDGIDCHR